MRKIMWGGEGGKIRVEERKIDSKDDGREREKGSNAE